MGLDYYTMDDSTQVTIPYPAQSQQASAVINEMPTDVTSISFFDKIMITITQNGRLGQWVRTYRPSIRKLLLAHSVLDFSTALSR